MTTYNTNTPEGMAKLEELLAQQDAARGFNVTRIDKDAFMARLNYGDWSAEYLGKAFCSMYRTDIKFNDSLLKVCNLDSEGTHFLFQIIFARSVPRWSCDYLYSIEQDIKDLFGWTYEDDQIVNVK